MRRDAEALLRLETVDLQRPVGELPVAQRQMIAIAAPSLAPAAC